MSYMVTISPSPNCEIYNGCSRCGRYFHIYNKIAPIFQQFSHEYAIEPTLKKEPHIHVLFKTDVPIEYLKLWLTDKFYNKICNPHQNGDKWIKSPKNSKYPNAIEWKHGWCLTLTENFDNSVNYLEKDDPQKGYQEACFQWIDMIKSTNKSSTKKFYYTHNFPDIPEKRRKEYQNMYKNELYELFLTKVRQTFISLSPDKILQQVKHTVFQYRQEIRKPSIDITPYQQQLDKLNKSKLIHQNDLATVASPPPGYKA